MGDDTLLSADNEPPSRRSQTLEKARKRPTATTSVLDSESDSLSLLEALGFETEESRPKNPVQHGVSARTRRFCELFFPQVTNNEWNDWQWQVCHTFTRANDLRRIIKLSSEEAEALRGKQSLPLRITPYYASLFYDREDTYPLRKAMVPLVFENLVSRGEERDPLHEGNQSPVPGIVHRYPDRVLFLSTTACSCYCRYCTRSRIVGHVHGEKALNLESWIKGIDYIASNRSIRDVLISGGDPLTLSDDNIQFLLSRLRRIPHVEIIRIGTKTPVVLPQRITPQLVRILKKYHPLYMSIHFTHPDELTPETSQACARLADAGIVLGSQTVLLAGINDCPDTMRRLVQGLLRIRVRPYYLYQCDPILGSSHFRTPVEKGIEIIRSLRGHTTGYAVPTYVIDAPGGGGKTPVAPETIIGRENGDLVLQGYDGGTYRYPDTKEWQSAG